MLGKAAEKAEGRRGLEERAKDGVLSVGVLREAIIEVMQKVKISNRFQWEGRWAKGKSLLIDG